MGNYLNLEIKKIIKETNETVSLILQSKNGKPLSFLPGQFLTFLINDNGAEVKRGFSISSTPDDLPLIRITVKKIHEDSPSSHWIDDANIGDVLKSLPPLGNFTIPESDNIANDIIMFGAGSGITPLFSMLKHALLHNNHSNIVLFYGNKNDSTTIFKSELSELENQYSKRFKIVHIQSQPNNYWDGATGRITKEKVLDLLSNLDHVDPQNANYFICGPDGMMKNVLCAVDELGISHKKIHRENYEVQILEDDDEIEESEREVTIFIHGEKHVVIVEPGESIMEKAFKLGLEIPNSCQQGECGTCRARLLSGKLKLVSQTALSEIDLQDGYCLTCVGYPASDNVVILYEDPFED